MCTVKEWKKVDASLITFLQFVVGGILEVEMHVLTSPWR